MNTFLKLFEDEIDDTNSIMSLENKILMCKNETEKLKLQHLLDKLKYQQSNKK